MPYDERLNEGFAEREFPQLLDALDAVEKLLKKLRGNRNKGLATPTDVERARQARDLLLRILDQGSWRHP